MKSSCLLGEPWLKVKRTVAPKITKSQLKQDHRGPAVGCVGESILKGVYRMLPSRRSFFRTSLLGLAGLSATRHFQQASGPSSSLLQADPLHPAAAQSDRLPLQWHKRQAKTLREKCGEKDCAAVLLRDRWNIIYYTGLFHTTTERPFWVLLPISEEAIFWYSPGLDRDLVDSWWSTDNEYYFDYLHSRKAYPNRGKVEQKETLDLWEWMLRGLKERGFANQVIGVDKELSSQQRRAAQTLLPQAAFRDISQICIDMRMVKTDEEIALTQRAYDYFSKVHAFARDYILQHGTDATDFDVGHVAAEYATDLILADIQRDGKPHSAVALTLVSVVGPEQGRPIPTPTSSFTRRLNAETRFKSPGASRSGAVEANVIAIIRSSPPPPGATRSGRLLRTLPCSCASSAITAIRARKWPMRFISFRCSAEWKGARATGKEWRGISLPGWPWETIRCCEKA